MVAPQINLKFFIAPYKVLDILATNMEMPRLCVQALIALYYENGAMSYASLAHKLGREWKDKDPTNKVYKAVAALRRRNLVTQRRRIQINGNGLQAIAAIHVHLLNIKLTEHIL